MNVLVLDIEIEQDVTGAHPHVEQFLEKWEASEELVAN